MRKLLRAGIRTAAAYLATGGVVAAGLIAAATPAGAVPAQQARLAAADGAEADLYGASVAVDGNTAVVGALGAAGAGGEGAVYVLVRNGTTWAQQAKLVASDGQAGDHFGASVAISGSTVVIGADAADGAATDQGAAYVFVRSGTAWSQQAKVTASDGASFDGFGQSVALSGDSALVGSPVAGGAYVYVRSGPAWSQQAKLTAAGADGFGNSVDLDGDSALVGALNTNAGQGAAYVFTRSGTSWSQQAQLVAADGLPDDWFGNSVSLAGDTAAIGATTSDIDDEDAQGAAYVFVRSETTWSQQAKLTAADGATGDFLAWSVALSGDTVLAGARGKTVGANVEQGAAYVFGRTGTTWAQKNKLTASDGTEDDNFGVAVALSGPTAVVGAPFAAGPGSPEQGAAHVFAESAVVTLRYYLHGNDIPGTAGGFTMNANQPPSQVLGLNLLNAPRWYGDPPARGTFGAGSTFTFRMPCLLGLSLATTYQVAATAPDGGNAQVIGQVTRPVELCIGARTVTIPVSTPRRIDGQRLRLQISTAASLNLNLNLGSGTYLQATNFTPDI
ncbi:FG-GAP repeat protein [Flindersiella endophytica]